MLSSDYEKTKCLLEEFGSVSLESLESVKLLNRIDTKFVFHIQDLPAILRDLLPHFQILEINQVRLFSYETLYFDTDDFRLYYLHHNGKSNRLKIRYRHYTDSGEVFFEVKNKIKRGRTDKYRLLRPEVSTELRTDDLTLIPEIYLKHNELKKKLNVCFQRFTLVNKEKTERLTLDINLSFDNFSQTSHCNQLVVAEIKQQKASVVSPAVSCLKRHGYHETGFSKYAIGIALLEKVKTNAFKPNLLAIQRILNGTRRTYTRLA
jgi:hypothetical protein